ncbi:tail fiber domain-containing protein [Sphingopyxis fribergensis]
MPTPFFADLVRELCQEGGTGPLAPAGAVPGHRSFAAAVPPGLSFHYAVAGIARSDEWETGLGRIDGGGRLLRDSVAASSNGGSRVDFAPGLKTIALTVGASWFAASDTAAASLGAASAALADGLAAKQPLSTQHGSAAAAEESDLVTVRRASGWVNLPAAALVHRRAAGDYLVGGALACADGSAAIPGIGFASDPDSGLFRIAADTIGLASGGAERMRIAANGDVALGGLAPAHKLHLRGGAPTLCIEATTTTGTTIGTKGPRLLLKSDSGSIGNGGEVVWLGGDDVVAERWAAISGHITGNSAANGCNGHLSFALRPNSAGAAGVLSEMLVIRNDASVRPGQDNTQTFGFTGARWSTIYAATGTINTSDAREKTWRGAANDAELRAARRIAGELGFYQWNDAIAAKGADGARRHFGVRAQAVWAIMADEGLIDPLDAAGRPANTPYAFLCWDAWDGGDRFGVRPDQLALFLIAAQEQRLAALEAVA